VVIPQRSLLVTNVLKAADHLKAVICVLSCKFKKNRLVLQILMW